MKRRSAKAWLVRIAAVLFALAVAAIAGICVFFPVSYDRRLVDGFRIVKAASHEVAVCDQSGRVLVGVTVTGIGVAGDYIVGEVQHPTPGLYYPHADESPGFFAIDRRTARVKRGMTREQVTAFCDREGIAWPSPTNPDYWWMKR